MDQLDSIPLDKLKDIAAECGIRTANKSAVSSVNFKLYYNWVYLIRSNCFQKPLSCLKKNEQPNLQIIFHPLILICKVVLSLKLNNICFFDFFGVPYYQYKSNFNKHVDSLHVINYCCTYCCIPSHFIEFPLSSIWKLIS